MKVVVTGGAGFIGSHIVRCLLCDGHQVTTLDNFSSGKWANLRDIDEDIEVVEGDVLDRAMMDRVCEGAEVVFHQAALGSVARSIADPAATDRVNVEGTLNVLLAARDAGVRRVVYASSSSVYGDTPTLPKHEGMTPNPVSPYAVSKLTAELYCGVFTRVYGLETVSLRYFNVFGPRQDPQSLYAAVIPRFVMAMLDGDRPTVFGDGEQTRDFTYVDNVVEANMLAMSSERGIGDACNVATGGRISLNELLRKLSDQIGKSVSPVYTEPRPGDIRDSYAETARASSLLGYRPSVSVEEGLRRTVEWYVRSGAAHVHN